MIRESEREDIPLYPSLATGRFPANSLARIRFEFARGPVHWSERERTDHPASAKGGTEGWGAEATAPGLIVHSWGIYSLFP